MPSSWRADAGAGCANPVTLSQSRWYKLEALIEGNLFALFRYQFRQISVAVAVDAEPLRAWLLARGTALARVMGAHLKVLEESVPLGSTGAAALARDDHRELLIVFADNLTTLDLPALVEHHQRSDAAMTMVVHQHPVRIRFGAPSITDNQVIAFREKPTFSALVSSGVHVLGSEALNLLRRGEPGLVYNVASGRRETSVDTILRTALRLSGLHNVELRRLSGVHGIDLVSSPTSHASAHSGSPWSVQSRRVCATSSPTMTTRSVLHGPRSIHRAPALTTASRSSDRLGLQVLRSCVTA